MVRTILHLVKLGTNVQLKVLVYQTLIRDLMSVILHNTVLLDNLSISTMLSYSNAFNSSMQYVVFVAMSCGISYLIELHCYVVQMIFDNSNSYGRGGSNFA